MADMSALAAKITEKFAQQILSSQLVEDELTLELSRDYLLGVCLALRDDPDFQFNCLIDVCGVDYLFYGLSEWETESATATGFERGVDKTRLNNALSSEKLRFAVVYHLLSINLNQRIRLRVKLTDNDRPMLPSVIDIWPSANWFEREAFDLFGIIFEGHPDLRRILTDYGFIGHPFRKDFPLIGNVEVRYDAVQKRVIYEPVSIQPRILEPKVIRRNLRYETGDENAGNS